MRRYLPSLIVVFGLLVFSGIAILISQTRGVSPDTSTLDGVSLIWAGAIAALVGVGIVGAVFAAAIYFIAGVFSEERATTPAKEAEAAPRPARVEKKTEAIPAVPLSNPRSLTIFLVVIAVGLLLFLLLRALSTNVPPGYPLDRLPDLSAVLVELGGIPVTQGMAIGVAVLFVLGGVVVMGGVLATVTARLGKQTQVEEARAKAKATAQAAPKAPAARPAPTARPAAEAKAAAPAVPLSDDRSLAVFFIVVIVGVVGFLLFRWLSTGTPLGYIPVFEGPRDVPLFKLAGEPVPGWPEFLPGPGHTVTAFQVFALGLISLLVAVAAVGIALVRRVALVTEVRPASRYAVLLFVVALGMVVGWVAPAIASVTTAQRAVEATQLAAAWTPTPIPRPTSTPMPPPDEVFAQLPPGDPANGEALSTANACVTCHVAGVDPNAPLPGPSWLAANSPDGKGLADRAQERWQEAGYAGTAKSAEGYLVESILAPNAYVVQGFQPGIMPATYAALFKPQDLADIVAYMLTLK
ncbi:MAG: c-type cytochrome [Anaerolineales bacterium]